MSLCKVFHLCVGFWRVKFTGQVVGKGYGRRIRESKIKQEPNKHMLKNVVKPTSVLVAFELSNEDFQQRPLILVTELNTHTPNSGLGESERGLWQGGAIQAQQCLTPADEFTGE